jgi:DNA-binding NarL/FixJ family response regulator
VMTEQFRPEKLLAVMAAGASGYLIKHEISRAALLATLDLVLLGAAVIPRFTEEVVTPQSVRRESPGDVALMHGLSGREEAVLGLLVRGASNKHIAQELDIAEATVKVHVKSLFRKLHVANRTQAALWAMERAPTRDP